MLLQVDAKYRDATGFGLAMLNEGEPKIINVGVIQSRASEHEKTAMIWSDVRTLAKGRFPNVLPAVPAQLVPGRWPIFRLTAEGDIVMGLE